MRGDGGVPIDGDGKSVCKSSGTLVTGLDGGMRVAMDAARKIRQIVLHMLVRWRLRIYWVVKERIAMARQKSEIVLEAVGAIKGGSR